jgi:hypothetical protein
MKVAAFVLLVSKMLHVYYKLYCYTKIVVSWNFLIYWNIFSAFIVHLLTRSTLSMKVDTLIVHQESLKKYLVHSSLCLKFFHLLANVSTFLHKVLLVNRCTINVSTFILKVLLVSRCTINVSTLILQVLLVSKMLHLYYKLYCYNKIVVSWNFQDYTDKLTDIAESDI